MLAGFSFVAFGIVVCPAALLRDLTHRNVDFGPHHAACVCDVDSACAYSLFVFVYEVTVFSQSLDMNHTHTQMRMHPTKDWVVRCRLVGSRDRRRHRRHARDDTRPVRVCLRPLSASASHVTPS